MNMHCMEAVSVPMEPPLFSIRPKYRTFCETLVVILFCRAGRRFAVDRRLTVILAADVVGFSRLMEVDEERTHAAFSTCHTAIAGLVAKHRGRIFAGAGDSVLAEFASPVEAVRAAIDIQNDLAERRLDLAEGHQMKFRIGINLGDVIVDGSNLYGAGVNVAVRLETLAEPGGICLSGNIHEHVEQKLPLQYLDLGEQRVKNIAKPVHVYRVLTSEATQGVLSITAAETFATNWLVPRLGSFQLVHPDMALRLEIMGRVVDFAHEAFDVGIREGHGNWPGLKSHMLMPVEFTPLCSPEFLARAGNIAAPIDLLQMPLLSWSISDDWWREWFKLSGITNPEPAVRPSVQLKTQLAISQAAMAGQGIAILTPAFFAAEIATGRLIQPFSIVAGIGSSFWLVYPEDHQNSRKIHAFREWILEEVKRGMARAVV
ncbi:hypothetical protein CU102_25005 [Phyllobacterium brassicacearum]|uniref:Guanylate cyclase domain-containing protein n=2 Tax=Phyllobacterium brassicacearum TaxID=314235 RepID=A0A2P7B834_9HYPH|nr:hypothetical protein CU102_25005 [Phyllobacterium brassicacearum]